MIARVRANFRHLILIITIALVILSGTPLPTLADDGPNVNQQSLNDPNNPNGGYQVPYQPHWAEEQDTEKRLTVAAPTTSPKNTNTVTVSNTPPKSTNTVAVAGTGTRIANYALQFRGRPYVYGATGPYAFDCSGLTQYVYRAMGISIGRTTYTQWTNGVAISRANLMPGDLVFFYGDIGHVGIYIGNGQFIHAANEDTGVIVSNLNTTYWLSVYMGARRPW